MRLVHYVAGMALAISMIAPLGAQADEAADEAAIRQIWENYATHRVSGDAEAWFDLWDAEGVQMPPGIPARRVDTIREGLAERWAARPRDAMAIMPEEIVVTGDWAYSRGTYTVEAGDNQFEGKFMTIHRRQEDGSWRIYRDIMNPNN